MDGVTTICYGKTEKWKDRDEAIAFFEEAMLASEGSEQERYAKIYTELIERKDVCSDERGLSRDEMSIRA